MNENIKNTVNDMIKRHCSLVMEKADIIISADELSPEDIEKINKISDEISGINKQLNEINPKLATTTE